MCQHNQLSWCSSASLALCLTKPSYKLTCFLPFAETCPTNLPHTRHNSSWGRWQSSLTAPSSPLFLCLPWMLGSSTHVSCWLGNPHGRVSGFFSWGLLAQTPRLHWLYAQGPEAPSHCSSEQVVNLGRAGWLNYLSARKSYHKGMYKLSQSLRGKWALNLLWDHLQFMIKRAKVLE